MIHVSDMNYYEYLENIVANVVYNQSVRIHHVDNNVLQSEFFGCLAHLMHSSIAHFVSIL